MAFSKLRRSAVFALTLVACGSPRGAEDPRALFEGDFAERGSPKEPSAQAELASESDCRAAAVNIEALAWKLVVAEERDPKARAELERQAKNLSQEAEYRVRIDRTTDDCLADGVSAKAAQCAASARSEAELQSCDER